MTTVIRGTDNSVSAPAITGTDSDTGVYFPAANQMALATNGTQAVFIDSSQNVGVGTASPTQKLDVSGTAKATTVQATTLSDGTNSTSSTNCIRGSAKAWAMWTTISGSVSIQSSFNVSSVSRISSGQYTVNLTTAMADNKFAAVGCGNSGGTSALGQTPTWGDRQASVMPVTSSTISYINGQTNTATGMNDAIVNSVVAFAS